jgi:cytochrome P450
MLSVASYLRHYDPNIYSNPLEFRPERWLDGTQYPEHHFFPFGKGMNSCSGQHIAKLEIPTLVALLVKEFETELLGGLPEADWSEVLAVVRPEGWPKETNCRLKFIRRGR